ncbi:DNA mismatch repair protein MutS [Maribacter sp. PR1]|uniref:DNA mismatch repair protein MutS n=1 Tax=Maribacter cobaltidurans TaxID=1178778 RepID=A0ABU7IPI7_9FLAO|nr:MULTISPECIES: DNA mismatch repair protein MutS [Maribacter]MDC6387473.1 DNA mismatch repair protein MutS [Maribacter sp. PR1]MEE1974860.1 DNA mismatch repair protein MutS [Maribacter cobaltidurans]
MNELLSFYQKEINTYKEGLNKVKAQLLTSSMIRLVIFLLAALGVYLFFENTRIVVGLVVVVIVIFLFLVSRHTDLQYKRDKLRKLIALNEVEIQVLHRKFKDLPTGDEFKDGNHFYSQDIDLFGVGSFYQYLNRTSLKEGSSLLAKIVKENSIVDIPDKQESLKELGNMPHWRQDFSATASLAHTETTTSAVINWINNYKPFVPKVMGIIPWVFSGLSLLFLGLFYADFIRASVLLYWLLFGLVITGFFTKKATALVAGTGKLQSIFEQYNQLLGLIESQEFTSKVFKDKKSEILSEGKKTSLVLKEFSKLLGDLDQNNNILFLIFGNGLFLRGLYTCYKVEKWMAAHGKSVKNWFDVITFFDAQNSLGNFVFNHPEYAFPTLTKNKVVIRAEEAGHPLLNPEKSVLNDYEINREDFFIITGANMAGKSTFLRTVSLQIVMANMGLPVCAKSMEYTPIKLITSMRTTDSLTDDESYFFSELQRLKFVVDEIQRDSYFIVLDEILKGTNSTDKAKGSRQFVERLVSSKSTGIIATHDLSLCEVSKVLPQVNNYYFDAEIINDELHFDYTFKKGICQNMNASFLLRKMGIVAE